VSTEVPIQRFRTLDEARRALWVAPDDPALFTRIRHVWRFSARLLDRRIPRGLRRFSSIEAANAERERWIADRIDALVRERDRPDR
jgi:hypothetical protein